MTQKINVEESKEKPKQTMNVSPISGNPGNDESSSQSPRSYIMRGNSLKENSSKYLNKRKSLVKHATKHDQNIPKFRSSKESLSKYRINSKSGMLPIPRPRSNTKGKKPSSLSKNKSSN